MRADIAVFIRPKITFDKTATVKHGNAELNGGNGVRLIIFAFQLVFLGIHLFFLCIQLIRGNLTATAEPKRLAELPFYIRNKSFTCFFLFYQT